jgi:hypothetical protein
MSEQPTKPGYYWAKPRWKDKWAIVQVLPRSLKGGMVVYHFGTECRLSDFTFGPEVTKPEGLE